MANCFFDMAENIVGKGEKAGCQHFLLYPQCFQKASFSRLSKFGDCMVKDKEPNNSSSIQIHINTTYCCMFHKVTEVLCSSVVKCRTHDLDVQCSSFIGSTRFFVGESLGKALQSHSLVLVMFITLTETRQSETEERAFFQQIRKGYWLLMSSSELFPSMTSFENQGSLLLLWQH